MVKRPEIPNFRKYEEHQAWLAVDPRTAKIVLSNRSKEKAKSLAIIAGVRQPWIIRKRNPREIFERFKKDKGLSHYPLPLEEFVKVEDGNLYLHIGCETMYVEWRQSSGFPLEQIGQNVGEEPSSLVIDVTETFGASIESREPINLYQHVDKLWGTDSRLDEMLEAYFKNLK